MSDRNVYAPPAAQVADVPETGSPLGYEGERPPFFQVSVLKLVLLSGCTFGLYELYWFYKNWVLIKEHSEPDITPWARAFFCFFWCYSCFEFIRNDERRLDLEPTLPAGPLAVGWIAASLAGRLPEPYFLIGFLSPLLLAPVQRHVNHINALVAPDHDKNTRFSAWNWLALVGGGIVIGLIMLGLALSPHV